MHDPHHASNTPPPRLPQALYEPMQQASDALHAIPVAGAPCTATDNRVHAVLRHAPHIQACTHVVRHCTECSTTPPTVRPAAPNPAHGRLLLLALAMHVHSRTFLEHPLDEHAAALLAHAQHLSHTLPERPHEFSTAFARFEAAFDAWRERDKQQLVDTLVQSWVNIDDTRQQWLTLHTENGANQHPTSNAPTFLQHLERTLQVLQNRAKKLGTDTSTFLQRVRHARERLLHIVPSTQLSPVEEAIHQAFWDDFKRRLQEGDTDQLRALLLELATKLKALTPHRTDLHTALDQSVDVALLVQMVKHHAHDATHFLAQCQRLVDYLCSLAAPAVSKQLRTWYAAWTQQWHTGEHTFETLLPSFFRRMHTDIDRTMRASLAFRDALDQPTSAACPSSVTHV